MVFADIIPSYNLGYIPFFQRELYPLHRLQSCLSRRRDLVCSVFRPGPHHGTGDRYKARILVGKCRVLSTWTNNNQCSIFSLLCIWWISPLFNDATVITGIWSQYISMSECHGGWFSSPNSYFEVPRSPGSVRRRIANGSVLLIIRCWYCVHPVCIHWFQS